MKKITILLMAFYTFNTMNAAISADAQQLVEDSKKVEKNTEAQVFPLPYPCSGNVTIVEHFGKHEISGSKNTTVNNKGIVLKTEKESTVLSVHDGMVSAVFVFADKYSIIVRHGEYLSVYSGMEQVSVKKGQQVSNLQPLGNMGESQFLNFQWRKGTLALNPEEWLTRRD